MSKNTGTSELINYFDLGANGDVGIAGSLDINTIANATTDTDTFLVSDTGIIKYRTGSQLLTDIGAAPATGGSYLPLAGGTLTGPLNGTTATFSGDLIAASATINTPANAVGVLVNGRNSDNFSQIRFGANTGGGAYNTIQASSTSFDIISQGNTPITFGTNLGGGGGTRMTILGTGAVTLTGALNGTSANFSALVESNQLIVINGGIPAAAFLRNQDVTIVGPIGQGIEFGARSGANYFTAAQINGVLNNPATSGFLEFQTLNGGALGTRLTIAPNGLVTLTGALNGTSAVFSGAVSIGDNIGNALTYGRFSAGIPIAYLRASAGSTGGFRLTNHNGADVIVVNGANAITLDAPTTTTGAATFSSSVTATQFITGGTPSNTAGFTNSFYAESSVPSLTLSNTGLNTGKYTLGVTNGALGIWNNVTSSYRLFINSVGNVGIGTDTPAQKLHIVGNQILQGNLVLRENNGPFDVLHIVPATAIDNPNVNRIVALNTTAIALETGGTERMRITSGGNVGIGTATASNRLFVAGDGNVVAISSSNNSLSLALGFQGTMHGFLGGINSRVEAFSNNGGYVFLNASSVWVPASDIKRKRNFEEYTLGIDAIMGLKPTLYNMDFQEDGDEKQVGFIAQEVKEFIPQAYEEDLDFIGLNYNAIIVTMVKAIQELKTEIDSLKNQIK